MQIVNNILVKIVESISIPRLVLNTDKNREKIMRKRQKIVPNFVKMRIFLSKLANYSTFPMILVSECVITGPVLVCVT